MAILNVSGWEYLGLAGGTVAPCMRGLNSRQNKTFTATSQRLDIPLTKYDKYLRIAVDSEAYVIFGDDQIEAVAGDILMSAGDVIIIENSGYTHVAAIQK